MLPNQTSHTLRKSTLHLFITLQLSIFLALLLPMSLPNASNSPSISAAHNIICLDQPTLEEVVGCIGSYMPQKGSSGYTAPTLTAQADWQQIVGQMLDGHCHDLSLLSLSPVYTIAQRSYENQSYCLLLETADQNLDNRVDKGWGTFIVHSAPQRELHIQIAHPKADVGTAMQGITVFKETRGRSFLMAGAHREANISLSSCQPTYFEADVAHNANNLFQPAVNALQAYYDRQAITFAALQFHGAAVTSCPGVDIYLTHGRNTPPSTGDKILELQTFLKQANPQWAITVPGDEPTCNLHGSENVQGRLLNGVSAGDVCTMAATGYNGRFIHIEQKSCCRDAAAWVSAINQTWRPYKAHLPFIQTEASILSQR